MLRLRATAGLSLLALVVGIAGTAWMSSLTSHWQGPPARYADAGKVPRVASAPARPSAPVRTRHVSPPVDRVTTNATPAPPPALVPLLTPSDTSQPWYRLRGHLDGRVLLHVEVDGGGRVSAASMVESSGDPVLDEHALRSVRGWRFAVPASHPEGMAGELPMRFSSRG